VTGGLSARGLANVAVRDWSDDFTFIILDHRYLCRSSIVQFLSSQVSELQSIDAAISELRLDVEDGDDLFGSVLEAARRGGVAVDSAHRQTFALLSAIQTCINLFVLSLGTKSWSRTSLTVFNSCRRLDATFQPNWNSLRRISTISYVVPMH
jgi:hypothetical protein